MNALKDFIIAVLNSSFRYCLVPGEYQLKENFNTLLGTLYIISVSNNDIDTLTVNCKNTQTNTEVEIKFVYNEKKYIQKIFMDLNEWIEHMSKLPFDEYTEEMKTHILSKGDLTLEQKKYFEDCYNYIKEQYLKNRPLDAKLLYIHMTQIKGYKTLTFQDFIRILMLVNFCGFSVTLNN